MSALASQPPRTARPAPPRRAHFFMAALFFTAIAIYGSLVPLNYQPLALDDALQKFRGIQYLNLGIQSRADWVANILLFIPLGFLWLGSVAVDRSRIVAAIAAAPLVAMLAGLSLAIEFAQLWFPGRTVSQNDIIAETIGGTLGVVMWFAAGQPLVDWARSFFTAKSVESRWHRLLQLYVLGLCIYSVMPLDLTISVGELYQKFKDGKIVYLPFAFGYRSAWDLAYNVLIDAIVFVPVGALATMGFFRELSAARSLGRGIACGTLVVVGIELAQIIVFSRVSDVTDLITCTAGVAAGAWLAIRFLQKQPVSQTSTSGIVGRGFWKWLGITTIYMIVLVGIFWAPFEFRFESDYARPRLAQFFEVPFKWLYRGSEFKAMQEFLRKTLFFGVLGALCVQVVNQLNVPITIRRVLLFAAIVGCAGWAMGIELGQIVQPTHTPDFTDVLLCTLGATAGVLIASRVLRSSRGVA